VWSTEEIEQVLGKDDAAFFAAHYDVTPQGNFEGHNILKLAFVDRIVVHAPDTLPASHPAQEKIRASKESAAFICVGERCSLPVMEPEAIAERAAQMRR
jgi:uncharacterized protein YyaL (SSP411 family)